MGKERRRYRRFAVENLVGNLLYSQEVKIVNLSIDGMLVESRNALRPGALYSIKIGADDELVELSARVRRCFLSGTERLTTGETATVYEAGLAFEGTLTEKAASLVELIHENRVVSLERRIFGRFEIRLQEAAELSTPCEFAVETLSLSGMKIRTTVIPRLGTAYQLAIGGQGSGMELEGRVAFVREIHAPLDRYVAEVGVQFLNLGGADRTALVDLLNDHTGIAQLPVDEPIPIPDDDEEAD